MQSRRERVRQSAIDEIKSIAWEIAKADGTENVTVNGIARRMGMTPPAFYSYFKSREKLIHALIVDAYRSFRQVLITARDSVPESDIAGRFYHLFMAYREWAVTNPNMFGLFAGRQVQGFDNREPEVMEEAEKVYGIFIEFYQDAWRRGVIKLPDLDLDMPAIYAAQMQRANEGRNLNLPLEIVSLLLSTATQVHGMISMELSGRFTELVGNPFQFYQFQILCILKKFGITYEPEMNS
ncbi:MAG: TetR/AcrR family transcriptional regulator [Deltaproteobacteria bacterium]|nr:TetR/AcrR family transcriptional regulator [Deltaproteobacteria bacterium]